MKRLVGWTVAVAVAFLFLLPLLWMVGASLRPETHIFSGMTHALFSLKDITLSHYPEAWHRAELGIGLLNSCVQLAGIIGLGLMINAMAAYAFARLDFKGRDTLFACLVVLIILPVEVLVIPLFLTVRNLHLLGGWLPTMGALILPFSAKAFNIYFLRQHFLSLPTTLEEAARVDGAGLWQMFWKIALPSIKPALVTVVVIDVLFHWGSFLWPLVVCTEESTRTVQLSLANLFTQPPIQWGDILACAVMTTLPVLLFFRTAQHHVVMVNYEAGIK